ncbi:MAG: metallophosphoesterase [Bacteroidota bacterium]
MKYLSSFIIRPRLLLLISAACFLQQGFSSRQKPSALTIQQADTVIHKAKKIPVANGMFLSFSDLHFDPFSFQGITDTLLHSPVEQWAGIFEAAAKSQGLGGYGNDVNYNLFISAVQKMKRVNPHPDFIVMSGDFISHDFGLNFQSATGIYNSDTLFGFIRKTIGFVTSTIEKYFPGISLFPVLGNNDSYCGDYQGETSGIFFKQIAQMWYPLVKKNVNARAFRESFYNGGYYEARNPADSAHTILVLNTVLYSSSYDALKYPNYCSRSKPDSAGILQMAWLKNQLRRNRAQGKKVWILSHVPPGINAYASSGGPGSCTDNISGFWKDSLNQVYLKLLASYKDVVQLTMAGHTHMDNFQLFLDSNYTAYNFIHLTPSISPIFNNNPAFQEISYIKGSAAWKDYTTWFLPDMGDTTHADPWQKEYSFGDIYGETMITAQSLKRAFLKIYLDTATRKNYMRFYNTGNTYQPAINGRNFLAYWCSIGYLNAAGYGDCACGIAAKPKLFTNQNKP